MYVYVGVCVCEGEGVCVCVWLYVCVCVCVCVFVSPPSAGGVLGSLVTRPGMAWSGGHLVVYLRFG